ncbi:hypothetical protein RFI_05305, partial [Reticulomyxa filosa]
KYHHSDGVSLPNFILMIINIIFFSFLSPPAVVLFDIVLHFLFGVSFLVNQSLKLTKKNSFLKFNFIFEKTNITMENLLNIKKTDSSSSERIYSEQKEEHKMNQRALEEAMKIIFVKPKKEVEDKIYFESIAVFALKTK